MKRLKRLRAVVCASVLATAACLFASCGETAVAGVKLVENSETLVVIEATETGGSLYDAMKKLEEEEKLTFEGEEGQYGFYLTSVNGKKQAFDSYYSSYWTVYTSLCEYEGVSYSDMNYGVYTYREIKCFGASYGVSGIPMVEGNYYLLNYTRVR